MWFGLLLFIFLSVRTWERESLQRKGQEALFFPSKTPPGLCFEGHNIRMHSNGTKLFFKKFLRVISLHTAPQGIKFEFRTAVWFFGSYFILFFFKKLPFLKQRLREREILFRTQSFENIKSSPYLILSSIIMNKESISDEILHLTLSAVVYYSPGNKQTKRYKSI